MISWRKASTARAPASGLRSPSSSARLAGAHPRRGEEGGLPAGGAGPLGGPRLGGHLDRVGANDRRGRELQPHHAASAGRAAGRRPRSRRPWSRRRPRARRSPRPAGRRRARSRWSPSTAGTGRRSRPARRARGHRAGRRSRAPRGRGPPARRTRSPRTPSRTSRARSSAGAWSRTKRSVSGTYRGSGEPLPGSSHVVGNLVARRHQLAEALRRVAGHRPQGLWSNQVTHARRLRPGTNALLPCNRVAAGTR